MLKSALTTPWYADGLRFTCTMCGNCCTGAPGYVWITPAEGRAIAAFLGLTEGEFLERYTRAVSKGRRSLNEYSNGDCAFLIPREDGSRICRIHSVRPTQCRTWPFWNSNLASPRAWEGAARHCPGMNQGQHHSLPVIQAALAQNRAAGLSL